MTPKMSKAASRMAAARTQEAKAAKATRAALQLEEARHYIGGFSANTVFRLVEKGLLRPNRSTGRLLFPISELNRFIRDGQTNGCKTLRKKVKR